jgi:hypothetical protein
MYTYDDWQLLSNGSQCQPGLHWQLSPFASNQELQGHGSGWQALAYAFHDWPSSHRAARADVGAIGMAHIGISANAAASVRRRTDFLMQALR